MDLTPFGINEPEYAQKDKIPFIGKKCGIKVDRWIEDIYNPGKCIHYSGTACKHYVFWTLTNTTLNDDTVMTYGDCPKN